MLHLWWLITQRKSMLGFDERCIRHKLWLDKHYIRRSMLLLLGERWIGKLLLLGKHYIRHLLLLGERLIPKLLRRLLGVSHIRHLRLLLLE